MADGASRPDLHRCAAVCVDNRLKFFRFSERTLAERLIGELATTEFHPENYEDEYRKRLSNAIEQNVAGQETQTVEVDPRSPTVDLEATLKKSLEARRPPAKAGGEGTREQKPAVERKQRRAS
jgi:non-homologous end joining protein Ku